MSITPVQTVDTVEELFDAIDHPDVNVFLMNLSPSDAACILDANIGNRTLKKLAVERYALDMTKERWAFTGDSIKFDKTGRLIDGQHRMNALSSMGDGFSAMFLVVTGLDPKAQDNMDQNTVRSAGDILSLAGVPSANALAAAARAFMVIEDGRIFKSASAAQSRASNIEVNTWISSNEWFKKPAYESARAKTGFPPRVVAACYAMFSRIDSDDAAEFLEMLSTGANLNPDHPVLTLRERANKSRREKILLTDRDAYAFIITAWNAYRRGNNLTRLQRPRGGVWTEENFPIAA